MTNVILSASTGMGRQMETNGKEWNRKYKFTLQQKIPFMNIDEGH